MGNYSNKHTKDMCDKCEKEVGINNLIMAPYLFFNLGDTIHPDFPKARKGYKQYNLCKDCYDKELRIIRAKYLTD